MRVPDARDSEVTSPERRGFILVLGAMSVLFLVVETLAWPAQPTYVLAARLVMSALLIAAPPLLRLRLAPRAVRGVVYVVAAGVCLSFATIAWGTGGTASPYFAFLPMLPLVFTIAVPDVPLGSLVAGACAAGVGLARLHFEGAGAGGAAFWVLAFTSTTTYAVIGSIFNRRQRARERRLVAERARAEEILAESERRSARAERLALVGRLASGVAHDVAAPLSAVTASVRELERSAAIACRQDPLLPAAFADVRAALDRIQRTVANLAAFSREDTSGSEVCELGVLVEEANRTVRDRFRAPAAFALAAPGMPLPSVLAVRARFVDALVWILVDASGRGVHHLAISARRDGASVDVVVEDGRGDLALAARDLPAATIREAGLALALAREELAMAGCDLEPTAPGSDLRGPLRIRCAAADATAVRAIAAGVA